MYAAGLLALKQDAQPAVSRAESYFKAKGKVTENKLKGFIPATLNALNTSSALLSPRMVCPLMAIREIKMEQK
jgi:hypothetical protein